MQNKPLTAGDPIECRCTKCRKITNHIIIAMIDETPAKVECNTCSGQHKYRVPATKKATVRRKVDPKVAEQKEWAKLQDEIETASAAKYAMTDAFKVGTVIKHPSFGLGLVQAQAGPQKIEVLFEAGKKIMRCK